MSGKQMEGDNQRRRALARQARQRGDRASRSGATLGSAKQVEHRSEKHRDGPPAAGSRKPVPGRGGPPPAAPAPERPWPLPDPDPAGTAPGAVAVVQYRQLVHDVARHSGVDFDQARAAAEATVLALAQALEPAGREQLLDAVPPELGDDPRLATTNRRTDLAGFLDEVARLSGRTPEQARYQAQATLGALAAQDPDLVDSLELPTALTDLLGPSPAGGDGVGPAGGTAALTDDELRTALAELPYWSGDRRALSRTIELPPDSLDRVLDRLARLKADTGRGPSIGRPARNLAVLTVRTKGVGAVTGLDVELAHRVDAAVDEAGAGLA
ncbi:DUF2267 domain-containing protein [Micromonospora zhanjiangensis]|uniref:Putative pterin-4-alpha-carbinolamine dehydratase n=1 Tax=Micromonospora zhanjiangensis TaxID=1522057 RepID=A0ABV8KT29_9ACTN